MKAAHMQLEAVFGPGGVPVARPSHSSSGQPTDALTQHLLSASVQRARPPAGVGGAPGYVRQRFRDLLSGYAYGRSTRVFLLLSRCVTFQSVFAYGLRSCRLETGRDTRNLYSSGLPVFCAGCLGIAQNQVLHAHQTNPTK
jgi:hypothetical protein